MTGSVQFRYFTRTPNVKGIETMIIDLHAHVYAYPKIKPNPGDFAS